MPFQMLGWTQGLCCCSGKESVGFVPAKHKCLEQRGKSEQPFCSAPHTLEQEFSLWRDALGPLGFLPGSAAKLPPCREFLYCSCPSLCAAEKNRG